MVHETMAGELDALQSDRNVDVVEPFGRRGDCECQQLRGGTR